MKGLEEILEVVNVTEYYLQHKSSSKEYVYAIDVVVAFLVPFKTLWGNLKSKELREEVKDSFIAPMAKKLQARFAEFNRADFEEANKMGQKFIEIVEFYFSIAGISTLAVKQMLSDSKNYLLSDSISDLSLIHICRCRRYAVCRSRWSPYH
eukprot:TRINITY_DN6872_c0_g1_i1.p3 TRINITY_DN6872_c0_g1~~TRINITY_DN6872_c0_g1_i1.p3  ORF type:complete len:151 (-),score=34.13 TRINITY_DN6872_c0_g1_i1:13-465(-)